MGFWNIEAKDLQVGDEIRVNAMGGEDFLEVEAIEPIVGGKVRFKVAWGWHVPVDPFWDSLPVDEKLTVRR